MTWLLIAVGGYLLNAFSALTDKFLLKRTIQEPVVYAFFVSVLGLIAFVFAPFDFRFPGFSIFLISLAAGLTYVAALLIFFSALKRSETSIIVSTVGGLTPLFVFAFAAIILREILSTVQIIAFFVILVGTYLISKETGLRNKISKQLLFWALAAGLLFGLSHVLSKFVYINHSFGSGIIWRSIGMFAGAAILFLIPANREKIIKEIKESEIKMSGLFLGGQLAAALSFILVNYAFSLGSIALVNALAGIQYVFLFLLVIFLSKKHPQIIKEPLTKKIISRKIVSLALIVGGIFILLI